tara:strand:+ start:9677 stop:10975 length:1299 start_codon:yes stop_codon:yes gene_type:complete
MATTNLGNDRVFYATQAVAISPRGTAPKSYTASHMAHGVQSIGITTNFNLEQVFELGQLEIYENVEGIPDVEVTMEKVIDGYPLLYHMATKGAGTASDPAIGPTDTAKFLPRSKKRCDVRLGIFEEEQANSVGLSAPSGSNTGGSDAQSTEVYLSGMFINSISYSVPVDGPATESVTFVGNNKQWLHSSLALASGLNEDGIMGFEDMALSQPGNLGSGNSNDPLDSFDGLDEPLARTSGNAAGTIGASGGVQRREDVLVFLSTLPQSIRGVNGAAPGNGNSQGRVPSGEPLVHLQSFSCSTDLGREDVLELGRKNPYARTANFPVEVTCDIEAITAEGDFVNALEDGDASLNFTKNSGENTPDETIKIVLRGGQVFDLGSRNRLSSVSYGGGDAGGGNATCTYSYTNFNVFEIRHHANLLSGANTYKLDAAL